MPHKKHFGLAFFVLVVLAIFLVPETEKENEVSNVTVYGNVDIREAQLAFNNSEHIKEILVEEGDSVNKGQLLAQLHTELLEANLTQAKAALLAQQLLVNKLEAGSRPQEIEKVKAELEAAKARAKAANDTYQRMQKLLKDNLASQDNVENLHSLAKAATAQVAAIKASLALLKAGPRQEDIAIAKAQLAARQAAVAQANQRLKDASLYAPDFGIIRNRILEPGDMAFPQTPVLTMAFTDPIWIRVYLSETVLGKVKPGAKATIQTDSFPDKTYTGWVGYISPTAEFTPKNIQTSELRTRLVYSARILVCNPNGELRLGMPATVSINLSNTVNGNINNRCN